MAVLWSLTCAAAILSLLQEYNLSNSMPHRGYCRTEAVNHLSRSLETSKMLKIILSKLKLINYQNQWYHTKLCFNINLTMYGLPRNMKSSSQKTWQTSLLFLKPLQIQNLKRKKWGDMAYYVPPGPSPGFSSRGAKNQMEGPKTRRGSHIFKIRYWMYGATKGQTWNGGHRFQMGGRAPLAPLLATALCLPPSEKVGRTRPPCPPPNCVHAPLYTWRCTCSFNASWKLHTTRLIKTLARF